MSHPTDSPGPIEFGSSDGMHYRIIRDPSGLIEFVELGRDPERPPPPAGPAPFLMDSGVPVSISTDAPSVVIGTEGLSPSAFEAISRRLIEGFTTEVTTAIPSVSAETILERITEAMHRIRTWRAGTDIEAGQMVRTDGDTVLPVGQWFDPLPGRSPDQAALAEALLQRVDEMAAERDRAREPEFDLYISDWAEWDTPWGAARWTADPADHDKLSSLGLWDRWLSQNPITGEVWRYEPGELEWDLPFRSPCP